MKRWMVWSTPYEEGYAYDFETPEEAAINWNNDCEEKPEFVVVCAYDGSEIHRVSMVAHVQTVNLVEQASLPNNEVEG